MPHGDPAGYLPNVVASRKKRGEKAYQPKGKKRSKKRGKFFMGRKAKK